jgi:hypothetical protein
MKLGLPLATREKELADLKPANSTHTYDVRFQGKLRTFNVYTVRLELPKYRLENGRTSAAQQDYIAKNKVAKNFFDPSRSENDEVQAAQHSILKEMASNSVEGKNLFKFFAERDQEQPLILDHVGFVVNGNRRLCTYREIHEEPGSTRFTHIDVIVLPKCDVKDIDELEAHLQVERDIKQDYSWISLAFTLRQKLDSKKYTDDQLCAVYSISKKELQSMITQLTLAEEYLASRNKEGLYLELEKTEIAFDQLQKNRAKLIQSPAKQQFFSEVAFRIIDSPTGDRVYASIPDAREVLDDIRSALESEVLSEEIPVQLRAIEESKGSELFGPEPADKDENIFLATFKALRASTQTDKVQTIIQNAIEAKKERDRAARRGNSALEAIRRANTAMADAVTLLSAQTTTDGIDAQLAGIEQSIAKVRVWVGEKNAK